MPVNGADTPSDVVSAMPGRSGNLFQLIMMFVVFSDVEWLHPANEKSSRINHPVIIDLSYILVLL